MLLRGFPVAKKADWSNLRIVGSLLHLLKTLFLAFEYTIAPFRGVAASARAAIPAYARLQIGTIPPTAPARRIANRH